MSRTNAERVARAREALAGYQLESEGVETAMVDLITDLMHLCDDSEVLFRDVQRVAFNHYVEERPS